VFLPTPHKNSILMSPSESRSEVLMTKRSENNFIALIKNPETTPQIKFEMWDLATGKKR
jgi:hypothetical protein